MSCQLIVPVFTTTDYLHGTTPLPANTTYEQAVAACHDHSHLLLADPEYESHFELPREEAVKPFKAPLDSDTKRYRVTDFMPGVPAGFGLSPKLTYDCEIQNMPDGLEWTVKAPLGLVSITRWRIVKRDNETTQTGPVNELVEDGGEWALVEDVEMIANRLLIGTVKSKCEGNWRGIHLKFVNHLKGLQAKQSSTV